MPAEWTRHSGTQLHWPSNRETWPNEKRLERVEKVYIELISAMTQSDHVHLLCENEPVLKRAKNKLNMTGIQSGKITFHTQPVNDIWARDCGPIYVFDEDGNPVITNWKFNSWGEKYPPFDADDALPDYFAGYFNQPQIKSDMVLEGGSIDVNGKGTLLTTESVLLNPNRNPNFTKQEIKKSLKKHLGVRHIIWLKSGLEGDDTDGHIDDLTRFVSPTKVVTMVTDDKSDVNYKRLLENLDILKSAVDQDGNLLEIIELPMPLTKTDEATVDGSEYVPASYANFYIANNQVLLPLYDDRYDEMVIKLFQKLFLNHKITGIPCADLVWGQGSIHCITQQLYY